MAKLTKAQEKIIIAAGLDPAKIYPEKIENHWMNCSPHYIQAFELFGAEECRKAMASKDLGLLEDMGTDDDGFMDYALFSFCFYEKCETCKSKNCKRKIGGAR